MKKSLQKLKRTLIFIFLLNNSIIFSQSYTSSFDIGGGITQNGYAATAAYNYYTNQHDFIQIASYVTFADDKHEEIVIPYNDISINIGYFKNIYHNRMNSLKINIGAGGLFGYEYINKGETYLQNESIIKAKSKLIYGAFMGIDIDVLLNDKCSIILKANEYYHANSDIGHFVPYFGTGFRFFLN